MMVYLIEFIPKYMYIYLIFYEVTFEQVAVSKSKKQKARNHSKNMWIALLSMTVYCCSEKTIPGAEWEIVKVLKISKWYHHHLPEFLSDRFT